MSLYNPPVQDQLFLLYDVFGGEGLPERALAESILEEAAKLSSEILAPLNVVGDKQGAKLSNGAVTTSPGFKEAYHQYRDAGWNSVVFPEEFGGQGLPWALAFAVQEMWQGANMAFGLCPLLNQGAVEAILAHGSDAQKKFYLPKLIEGTWTGTMNLTEPQAGSDLGLLNTKAVKQADGTYKISGQKIFITYGEHDFADNIIHLVIARIEGAPADVKGISLFIVPKFLEGGTRNDVICTGIEHKLGIHASPTCTMQFGDKGGATGYLVGIENEGLKYMFTMMNNARLSVGLQGVAIAEASYQKARQYAEERVQGKSFETGKRVSIEHHPDVRRMLMSMQSQIEAGRALTFAAAMALDKANTGDKNAQARVEILTPIVKSWCTDMACEVTSLGLQIHGGMGYIEETGAAQFYRDARILPIYEGTNGIQGADLSFRKLLRDEAAGAKACMDDLERRMAKQDGETFAKYFAGLREATGIIVQHGAEKNMVFVAAAATPYLKGFALIAGAASLSRCASLSPDKRRTADFFIGNLLPAAAGHLQAAVKGSAFI
ncbi:MAG: acyl-CoA dehydrogenase [Alphaproteobacteria bacterium]